MIVKPPKAVILPLTRADPQAAPSPDRNGAALGGVCLEVTITCWVWLSHTSSQCCCWPSVCLQEPELPVYL